MQSKLVIRGAGGHTLVVADIVRLNDDYQIVGFLDDVNPERHNTDLYGVTILGGRDRLDFLWRKGVRHLVFGFGLCAPRLPLSELARSKGFSLATAIHPNTSVADDVLMGAGTLVMAGAIINPGVEIGENVIVNTSASVDHDCFVDGAHVGPEVLLAGRVSVERATCIGVGAVVIDGVGIGADSLIGAGAVVVSDIPEGVIAYGNPARVEGKAEAVD